MPRPSPELTKAPSVLQGAETRIPKDVATPSSYICRVNDFSRGVERCFRELAVCHVSRNPRTSPPQTGYARSKVDYEKLCHSQLRVSYSSIYVYIYIESYRSVLIFVLYFVGVFRCKAHYFNRNSNRLIRGLFNFI